MKLRKPSIELLKGIHGAAPVAILGGGPSLPDDLKKLPDGVILIGVNHHYQRLIKAHYCVFMDKPSNNAPGISQLKSALDEMKDTLRICQYGRYSDYELNVKFWNGGFSSSLATWLGSYISTGPILLCGMDCYQTEPYFYDRGIELTHRVYNSPLENHLKAWRPAFDNIAEPGRIRAVSGPLVELFNNG